MDYGKLNLRIARTYTTAQLNGSTNTFTPKGDLRLVVVDIKGDTPGAMGVILAVNDFVAESSAGKSFADAIGVELTGNQWSWTNYRQSWSDQKAAPFSFSVAFALDKKIEKFKLHCGNVILETQISK